MPIQGTKRDDILLTGQVTGIGSLPHLDPDEAVAFVEKFCPGIPFWPQLPQRSPVEGMIPQIMSPLSELIEESSPAHLAIKSGKFDNFRWGLHNAEAIFDENSASGFFAFERACQLNRFPDAIALKGQISGPITLGWCLFRDGSPLATLPNLYADLVDYLCRLACWQISRLKQFGRPVILFVDEPMLAADTTLPAYLTDGLRRLISAIHLEGAFAGVHSCATPAPVSLCSFQPDIISFDAHQGLETFLSRPEICSFIKTKGCLAFGLVPTWDQLDNFQPAETFARWALGAINCANVETLAMQSLVTATCGLGMLSVEASKLHL